MSTNCLEMFNKYRNQQGGTIHQAKQDYSQSLDFEQRTEFCNMLVANMFNLTDLYNMEWFCENRIEPEKYYSMA